MIIGIINQKGGVGKSTTAEALAAGLSVIGYKVLVVDLDAQRNLTTDYSAENMEGPTALEVLQKEAAAIDAVRHTSRGDIIAGSRSMNDYIKTEEPFKEYRLKEALDPLKSVYDHIILDTPPALSLLTINALTACTCVVVPAQAAPYSLQAIMEMASTLDAVKAYSNKDLQVAGILLTQYNGRTILSRDLADLAEQAAERLNTKVFNTRIREVIAIREAQAVRQNIFEYAPNNNVTRDYAAFIEELLNGRKEG